MNVFCSLALLSMAAPPIVLTGATVHPVDGPTIPKGVVVVRDGKIVAVGAVGTVAIPKDADIRDLTGLTLIPGLVDTHSHLGLFSRPGVSANSDGNEGSGPIQPALRALDAVSPDDPGIRMALSGGLTTANIMPGSGNAIGGQTVYVKMRGGTIEAMRVEGNGVLGGLKMANGENPKNFNFGSRKAAPGTRMKIFALQRETFLKARDYQALWARHREALAKDPKAAPPDRDLGMEPLVEVLERKRTVHFHCHRADDLMSALRLAKEFGFDLVLQHASEGYKILPELKAANASVSLTVVDSPGGKAEVAGLIEENAAALAEAGVRVAINTDDPVTESRFLLRTGSIVVRGGMSEQRALESLTINPARMLKLDHRVGSIKPGLDADLVVLSGSPFSVYSQVLETWIDGEVRFRRNKPDDARYQTGGFALPAGDMRHPGVVAPVTPLPAAKTPAGPGAPFKGTPNRYAIRAGKIFDGTKFLEGMTVVVDGGKIESVSPTATTKLPANLPVINAAEVTPGLIDGHGCAGISGGLNIPADQDQDETTDSVGSELRVFDAFNPDDGLLEFVRRHGVTAVHVLPGRKTLIAGQSAVFQSHGRTAEAMLIPSPGVLVCNLGEPAKETHAGKITTRMAVASNLRQAFEQGRAHAAKAAVKTDKSAPTNPRLDALAQAATGKLPVLFCAHRADDINTALRLAEEFKLDARLGLAGEGYLLADVIATSKIPVFLHPPLLRAGSSMETLNVYTGSARMLGARGVPIVLGSSFEGYVPKIRNIRSEAGAAAASGWPREEALASITSRAARVLGIDRGTIAAGKQADLALFDGDPLENATHATHTIIAGRVVYNRAEFLELPLARRGLLLSGASGPGCCLGW